MLGIFPKLEAQYASPFEILSMIGSITYELALHCTIEVHNMFHEALLKKYVHDTNHVNY